MVEFIVREAQAAGLSSRRLRERLAERLGVLINVESYRVRRSYERLFEDVSGPQPAPQASRLCSPEFSHRAQSLCGMKLSTGALEGAEDHDRRIGVAFQDRFYEVLRFLESDVGRQGRYFRLGAVTPGRGPQPSAIAHLFRAIES